MIFDDGRRETKQEANNHGAVIEDLRRIYNWSPTIVFKDQIRHGVVA